MCVSLQASQARILYARRVQQPVVKPSLPPVNKRIDDRLAKTFIPHKTEQGQDFNPEQFYRDVQGKERVLVYNHQTIAVKYRNDFSEIKNLEEIQNQVMIAQRTEDSPENQALYDDLQEQIDSKTANLRAKIRGDFGRFLTVRLGPTRMHLIPEITYRFSQKAFTTFIRQLNDHTTKTYGGFFTDGTSEETCSLHIPEDPKKPVTIEATTQGIYMSFMPQDRPEKVARPVNVNGHATYTIGLKGKTEATVDFSISDII